MVGDNRFAIVFIWRFLGTVLVSGEGEASVARHTSGHIKAVNMWYHDADALSAFQEIKGYFQSQIP